MMFLFFSDKVQALVYASGSKQLLSGSDDSILGIWNMDVKRIEVIYISVSGIKEIENSQEKHYTINYYGLQAI